MRLAAGRRDGDLTDFDDAAGAEIAVDFILLQKVGDAFDVAFRANRKNLALLKGHLEKHGHIRREPTGRREGSGRRHSTGPGPVIDVKARRVG